MHHAMIKRRAIIIPVGRIRTRFDVDLEKLAQEHYLLLTDGSKQQINENRSWDDGLMIKGIEAYQVAEERERGTLTWQLAFLENPERLTDYAADDGIGKFTIGKYNPLTITVDMQKGRLLPDDNVTILPDS